MAVINVGSKEAFDTLVSEGTVLVDFFATWCGPCKMLAPKVEEASAELSDVKVAKVDIDELDELAMKYRVMSVPTLALFKDGECVAKSVGVIPTEKIVEFAKQ